MTRLQDAQSRPRVKKLLPELRKRPIDLSREPHLLKRFILRLREDSQFLRAIVQWSTASLCIWIGIEFYYFVAWGLSNGASTYVSRPPGVEGFLPISALISLKYWLQTGIVNEIHPSGLFIFLAIVLIGLFLKKAFCSWLCPIGTISESLWNFGQKIFRRNLALPRWLDYPLRSLKYLLLVFFLWAIAQMDVDALRTFIYSPYNKVADIKMYLFFAEISSFALWTIITLVFLSVLIKNFWCRYLCPYGGLLGIVSWLSPIKVTRTAETCIDCTLCTRACPANITVHANEKVWSDECTSCLECVAVCPVKNTLDLRLPSKKKVIPNWLFGVLVVSLFTGVTLFAMLRGEWQNRIPKEEYLRRMQNLDAPIYQHFQGRVPEYDEHD